MADYSNISMETLIKALAANPITIDTPILQLKDYANAASAVLSKARDAGILKDDLKNTQIGDLSTLKTSNKDSVVSAINSVVDLFTAYVPETGPFPNTSNGYSQQSSIWNHTDSAFLGDKIPVTFNLTKDYSTLQSNQGIGFTFSMRKYAKDGSLSYVPLKSSTNIADINAGSWYLVDNPLPFALTLDKNAVGSTGSFVFNGLMEGLGTAGGSSRVQVFPRIDVQIKDGKTLILTGHQGEDFTSNTGDGTGTYYDVVVTDIWFYEISSTKIVPLANGTTIWTGNVYNSNTTGTYSITMGSALIDKNWAYVGKGISLNANMTSNGFYAFANSGLNKDTGANTLNGRNGSQATPSFPETGITFSGKSMLIPLSCLHDGFSIQFVYGGGTVASGTANITSSFVINGTTITVTNGSQQYRIPSTTPSEGYYVQSYPKAPWDGDNKIISVTTYQ